MIEWNLQWGCLSKFIISRFYFNAKYQVKCWCLFQMLFGWIFLSIVLLFILIFQQLTLRFL